MAKKNCAKANILAEATWARRFKREMRASHLGARMTHQQRLERALHIADGARGLVLYKAGCLR